ncbi:MAG: malto-oligosyltrehalose synthase, partial [Pseudomonadota bacterium]|nr:malto-oligosyltrehalose synthase [Pseudomonadota bacterium]
GYCRRLRGRLAELEPRRPADAPAGPAYLVIEKILGAGERLAEDWEVDGTSGYDFMETVSAVLHDPDAGPALAELWAALSGRPADFAAEEVAARHEILDLSFTAQLDAAVGALHRVALERSDTRDFSRPALGRALVELLAHFPVYRTYAYGALRPKSDDAVLARALAGARSAASLARPEVLELIVAWLRDPDGVQRQVAATRFQQLSAPVAAKAVEDTAFYRYGRLLSRNDVGFDAAVLGTEPAEFHRDCAQRGETFPDAMLATATHDHKRGEDVRARLAVLSEMPSHWGETLRLWLMMNARHRGTADALPAPSTGDETMLYQTIVGAWPMMLDPHDRDGCRVFAERLAGWQEKALHEAKLRTSWTSANQEYDAAARAFVEAVMADAGFAEKAAALANRIAPAGAVNGLAQVVLKATVPGVPDFYQGTEFWDQSLVDPDNRRPVDFDRRMAALRDADAPASLAASWRDGRVKQAVIARLLALRQRLPELFARGDYTPLFADGPLAAHVIAFVRRAANTALVVVVPRLPLALLPESDGLAIPASSWQGTELKVPTGLSGLTNVIGDASYHQERLPLGEILAGFPVAVLVSPDS